MIRNVIAFALLITLWNTAAAQDPLTPLEEYSNARTYRLAEERYDLALIYSWMVVR